VEPGFIAAPLSGRGVGNSTQLPASRWLGTQHNVHQAQTVTTHDLQLCGVSGTHVRLDVSGEIRRQKASAVESDDVVAGLNPGSIRRSIREHCAHCRYSIRRLQAEPDVRLRRSFVLGLSSERQFQTDNMNELFKRIAFDAADISLKELFEPG